MPSLRTCFETLHVLLLSFSAPTHYDSNVICFDLIRTTVLPCDQTSRLIVLARMKKSTDSAYPMAASVARRRNRCVRIDLRQVDCTDLEVFGVLGKEALPLLDSLMSVVSEPCSAK